MLLQRACSNNRIILEAVRSWDRLTLKTRLLSPTGMHSISSSPTPAGSDSQILEILSMLSMLSIDRLISHRRTEFCTARSGMIRTPNRAARAVRGPRLRLDMLLQLTCSNNRVILEAVRPYGTA